ncbi:MAG TPA: hypothetical protein VIC05_04980 [Solirubrobacteraceae bacterium]|jgi:DNA-binding NarL/FixJ family response regulator
MARVLALIPDLLFGSRVQSMLSIAGHDVRLLADPAALRAEQASGAVLVVDLTGEFDGPALLRELAQEGSVQSLRTLGFYAHVDPAMRARALAAGFEVVVPRSRFAREGGELIERLLAEKR